MKLAIGAVGDQYLDSNVFIEAGSLTTAPPNVPGAPTNVTVDPGDGSAVVSWMAPDSVGGSPIDLYTVTCTATANADDSHTATVNGTTTSAQVDGLTNGVEYTCSVTAHNADSASEPSVPAARIEWAVSDPSAVTRMFVKFLEKPALTHGMSVKDAEVYKDGVLVPDCGDVENLPASGSRHQLSEPSQPTPCVSRRESTSKGGGGSRCA